MGSDECKDVILRAVIERSRCASVKPTSPFQLAACRRWSRWGTRKVFSDGPLDERVGPVGVVVVLNAEFDPVGRARTKRHTFVGAKLGSLFSDHTFGETDIERSFVVEVRHLASADPQSAYSCESSVAERRAVNRGASLEEGVRVERHGVSITRVRRTDRVTDRTVAEPE